MKSVVVYSSITGFTKKYAEWIAEDLGCEICMQFPYYTSKDRVQVKATTHIAPWT